MAMITAPADLIVGTNMSIDTAARTFTLYAGGSLVAKDGVDMNALWSKFVQLWATPTYNVFTFPMTKIDNRSGQYYFGKAANGAFTGWKPGDNATRAILRNGGWNEYSSAGVLNRVYFNAVLQGSVPSGSQCYYQLTSTGSPANYTYTDLPNEAIQVYGDASNGNFDSRTFFKSYNRTYGYTFDDVSLTDVSETASGPYRVPFGINTVTDTNLTANDTNVVLTPYDTCTIAYDSATTNRAFGSNSYPFKKLITHSGLTRYQIYTRMQYLLRQSGDINTGGTAGTVIGKTADAICWFVGSTLYSRAYFVPIDADQNDIVFIDDNGVERTFPYVSFGTLSFNDLLVTGGTGYYTLYYTTTPNGDDYGENTAVIVKDNQGNDITGTISSSAINFSFDWEGNTQGGYTGSTTRNVTLVWGRDGAVKPSISTGSITQSKTILITAAGDADLAYV